MKMMVKLAVLFATLLLLTGVSFAIECNFNECYEVKTTDLDNPTVVMPPFFAIICLDYGYKTGKASRCKEAPVDLSLFFEPLGMQVLAYDEDCVQSFKFHGSNNNVVTGIGYCEGVRFTTWGHKTDWDKCNCVHP